MAKRLLGLIEKSSSARVHSAYFFAGGATIGHACLTVETIEQPVAA